MICGAARRRQRHRIALAAAAAALAVLFGSGPISAQNDSTQPPAAGQSGAYSDDEVKAAFLYNFGTYVQWPPNTRTDGEITIAILGAPTVAAELERFIPGRTIQGMTVRVRRLRTINDLTDDQVLFIGSDENWHLRQLVNAVNGRPTLIVTDAPDGLSDGAMINFQLLDRRVRFEISLLRAQEAGLMLSSRLLSAALRVETTRCRTECRERDVRDASNLASLPHVAARLRPRARA